MRTSIATMAFTALFVLASAVPGLAQDAAEPTAAPPTGASLAEFERPSVGASVGGSSRGDGTIVLQDADYCSYLLSEIWGERKLTFRGLIDRSVKQKKAKRAAFAPFSDEATLTRCAEILDAFRDEAPEGDTLPPWAREAPVVPAALEVLLPADVTADPLAEPAEIGDGARTIGFGDARTAPFILWGGAYFVEVADRACDSWSGAIRSTTDPTVVAASVDATTYVYGVPTGNYFWDVTAPGCDWSVDLVVFEIPPDPTPTPTPKAVVPALVGGAVNEGTDNPDFLTLQAAAVELEEAGLKVNSCQIIRHRILPEGRVVTQVPSPGALVEPGSAIAVSVRWPADCTILPLTDDARIF